MKSTNGVVQALLIDFYELTMAAGYLKNGRHGETGAFELFFRKNPFGGEFTIFAGLEEVLRFVEHFRFAEGDLAYLKTIMPQADPLFFEWLAAVDCSKIRIWALAEGTVAFPRVPLIRVEGPIAVAQMLETALLNLVNYASLETTNAARYRLTAGRVNSLVEFGLRRAQGPDGALSASRYSYLGGFDGTSNVLAGKTFGIPVKGTMAHSFIQSFSGLADLPSRILVDSQGNERDLAADALAIREELGYQHTNESELAAFIGYALTFPKEFLALVDSYDTLSSGVPNFICVGLALARAGYRPLGVRIDSGDLAYLSKEIRFLFRTVAGGVLGDATIMASNDINEDILLSLGQQGTGITGFGIGTHLVTCHKQPALGCVYKLVEINGVPRIKLSQDLGKVVIPGRKQAYRLFGKDGYPIVDLMMHVDEEPPRAGGRILCRHPFEETKRMYVVPARVEPLQRCVWDGKRTNPPIPLSEQRKYVLDQLEALRPDHLRVMNPTPYRVSVSERLYSALHQEWLNEAPIPEVQ